MHACLAVLRDPTSITACSLPLDPRSSGEGDRTYDGLVAFGWREDAPDGGPCLVVVVNLQPQPGLGTRAPRRPRLRGRPQLSVSWTAWTARATAAAATSYAIPASSWPCAAAEPPVHRRIGLTPVDPGRARMLGWPPSFLRGPAASEKRMSTRSFLTLALLTAVVAPVSAAEAVDLEMVTRIRDEGFTNSKVMDTVGYLPT